jgi:competence protein ComEC
VTGIAAGAGALTGVALGWWGAVAVAAGLALVLLVGQRDRIVVAVCGVAVATALLGAWRADDRASLAGPGGMPGTPELATVTTAPVETGQRQYFVAEMASGSEREAARYRVCVTAGAFPAVHIGDVVRFRGDVRAARDAAGVHRAAMMARGCEASLFATHVQVVAEAVSPARVLADVRARIGATLRQAAPGDAGVLLTGLVTGDDAGFSPSRQQAFIRTGTTHLTAVSGSNLALVASILAAVGAATVGRHRMAWQIATVGGVWAYALISGAAAPAVRAAIVATAAILAFRFGRRPDFPTLILLAAGAMALIDPGQVDALGFRLSVAASLALAVVLPPLIDRGRSGALAAILAATVAAQIATLPLLLPVFGAVSLTSLPANMVAAPLVAVAMPLAALAGVAGLVWWPLGEILAAPAILAVNTLIAVVDRLGAPASYVSVGVPPLGAAVILAMTGVGLLRILMGDALHLAAWVPRRRSDNRLAETRGGALSPPPALVFAREYPLDALGADADDTEEQPAGEEDRHEVADVG